MLEGALVFQERFDRPLSADEVDRIYDEWRRVGLMLGLEEQFDVEFPERLLNRRTFESIAAIRDAVRGLIDGGEA